MHDSLPILGSLGRGKVYHLFSAHSRESGNLVPKARHGRTGSPLPRGRAGMTRNSELPDFIAPKVAAEIEHWLKHLGSERRLSPKTVEAYRRDVLQFLAFL